MITIYISPSCGSCRKVRRYFTSLHIPFREVDILSGDLTKEDVKEILMNTENGTDEIISMRSKIMKEKNIDIESMNLSELIDFIVENPTVLKRPIIIDDRKMQIGYDSNEITAFLPPKYREILDNVCVDCAKYDDCEIRDFFQKYCDNNCFDMLNKDNINKEGKKNFPLK